MPGRAEYSTTGAAREAAPPLFTLGSGSPAAHEAADASLSDSLFGDFEKLLQKHRLSLTPIAHTIRPRRNIYIRGEIADDTYVLCEGWACRVVRLSDGRRQILSFLLPGDLFSGTSPFEDSLDFYVEAITEVRYAAIKNSELRAKVAQDPAFLDAFMKLCIAENRYANQRMVDLGQRLAEEKIALLILQLMERLDARGMVHDQSFAFPLRQLQIADAVGLTPVHVSRVMGMLKNSGLIELDGGTLKVLDLAKLRRVGGMR